MVESDFNGTIYPINPKADEILDKKAYPSITDVPEKIDLVIIAVPSKFVVDLVQECANQGVKNIVIISAGFKEIGGIGIERENKIKEIVKAHKINLVGPNCLGILTSYIDMNASFGEGMPKKGKIALISQSGAMAVAITDWAYGENIGFSKIVSLGNKAGIDENSCLEYLENDDDTDVIVFYLESFVDGKKFMEIARRVSQNKTIILFKSGTSEAGSQAVASHTGALAGGDKAVEMGLRQVGVIRVRNIKDLFDFARVFRMQPLPKGGRVAIVTNAGGPGVIATDAIEESKFLEMANFTEATVTKLKKVLPPTANTHNPVDVIGDALADRYQNALEVVLADSNVDIVLVILTPQIMTQKESTVKIISHLSRKYPEKTIFTSFMGGKSILYFAKKLAEKNIPNFIDPYRAVRSMKVMGFFRRWRDRQLSINSYQVLKNKRDTNLATEIKKEVSAGYTQLTQNVVTKLLKHYKITVPQITIAKNAQEACNFADEIGYPVVLKIVSDDVLHKTDSGGVRLDLKNKTEVKHAYEKIMFNIKKNCLNAKINGIMVQKMYHMGREVIIGMKRDPIFGPLIMFGLGGIYVEVMKDVSFRVAPFTLDEAQAMINEVKAIKLLKGVRGKAVSDIKIIAETILKISQMALDYPEIKELDLNPLIVFEKGEGAVAVDARFIL